MGKFVKGDVVVARIVLYKAGDIKKSKMDEVVDRIIAIIKA